MSGETETQVSGWTTDTLRAHFIELMDERDKRFADHIEATERALLLALEGANEKVAEADRRYAEGRASDTQRLTELANEREKRQEQAHESARQAVQAALTAAKEAVDKAELAAERRFASVNEFRAQLSDQALTFLPRQEYARAHTDLEARLEAVNTNILDRMDAAVRSLNEKYDRLAAAVAAIESVTH